MPCFHSWERNFRSDPSPFLWKEKILALLDLHLITLLNDPNLHLVFMQEAGGEIHQYTIAPR